MRAILLHDSSISRDQGKILAEQHKYYRKLCTSDSSVIFSYTNDTDVKLDQIQRNELDKPFEIEEFKKALFSMQDNKTPGCDGISANWYKCFWEQKKKMN